MNERQVGMQCCEVHWKKLKASIVARGMDHPIAKNADEANRRVEACAERNEEPDDPLIAATLWMAGALIEKQGEAIKVLLEDGKCPVCFAMSHGGPNETSEKIEEYWTDGLCDALLLNFRERGLIPKGN